LKKHNTKQKDNNYISPLFSEGIRDTYKQKWIKREKMMWEKREPIYP